MAYLRLDKYLADVGKGTRSQVKNLIKQGKVVVNGIVVKEKDAKVDTNKDEVLLDGQKLYYHAFEYFMLNKPAGVVSAVTDSKDKTVLELITEEKRRDLFPVGRLDKDTEGLLVITNDGVLANRLLAPGKHVEKEYFVRVYGAITDVTVKQFSEGVDIGDEKITAPAKLTLLRQYFEEGFQESKKNEERTVSEGSVVLTEGRYHQVKRMFQAVEMEVCYLKRLRMGGLRLDENLECGEYRRLTDEEVRLLES